MEEKGSETMKNGAVLAFLRIYPASCSFRKSPKKQENNLAYYPRERERIQLFVSFSVLQWDTLARALVLTRLASVNDRTAKHFGASRVCPFESQSLKLTEFRVRLHGPDDCPADSVDSADPAVDGGPIN